ncbi:TetR/AcrR family transcriptional regulator [Leifsonia poae]|uniref:TetR/AcrR family transcriptional regulator n=1 Tax=Leifsonia poae TaxID=110933 RepID=UPI003D67F7CC
MDVPDRLATHLAWLTGEGAGGADEAGRRSTAAFDFRTALNSLTPASSAVPSAGYASGRARRMQIIDDAMALFAAGGFTATSLQEIAERVGVSKSALLYHFRSKDELLLAVLERRDESSLEAIPSPDFSARELLDSMIEGARRNAGQPGLVELYSVLAGEATSPAHPGHTFFRDRFGSMRRLLGAAFAELGRTGELPALLDPEREAVWFLALWDGLQFQWLYDRSAVDVAAHLRGHLDALLVSAP